MMRMTKESCICWVTVALLSPTGSCQFRGLPNRSPLVKIIFQYESLWTGQAKPLPSTRAEPYHSPLLSPH